MTTGDTRTRVLTCAATLAAQGGFDALSVAALSAASGVSNGSIYHHFGSKEGVLAALLVEIIESYQGAVLTVLDDHPDDAPGGVHGIVDAHLRWTEENRDSARLLHEHGEQVTQGRERERVASLNQHFREHSAAWLDRQTKDGALPAMSVEVAHAIVFAPAQEVCRLWLAGKPFPPPTSFSHALGAAAWAGLCAVSSTSR
ncbi:TetR/AcrR family transcriptional regulator [Streptomyces iakyrus]|uniref:TetR/AcrR family transcriptional regulator n=1 Tax=Streptomyces iakyrus TaxID=68219 RepID=UPI0033B928CA